ncbi:MAG: hypothetical protein GY754_22810 [bacterium]|nr:hypothetical protein [bacterium]
MKHTIIIILGMIIGAFVVPARSNSCSVSKTIKNLEIDVRKSKWEGCQLVLNMAYPLLEKNKQRNRSYNFNRFGLLMVFVGTEDYEKFSRCTGSRCLQLLPVKKQVIPSFKDTGKGVVDAVLPGGRKAEFSSETGELLWLEGFSVSLSPLEHMDKMIKKKGGINIVPEKGSLLFDYGWRTGEMSISQLWRKSVIYDGYGNSCSIKNRDVFKRNPKDRDEVIFKYDSNTKLKRFLRRKCPKIRFS